VEPGAVVTGKKICERNTAEGLGVIAEVRPSAIGDLKASVGIELTQEVSSTEE